MKKRIKSFGSKRLHVVAQDLCCSERLTEPPAPLQSRANFEARAVAQGFIQVSLKTSSFSSKTATELLYNRSVPASRNPI